MTTFTFNDKYDKRQQVFSRLFKNTIVTCEKEKGALCNIHLSKYKVMFSVLFIQAYLPTTPDI